MLGLERLGGKARKSPIDLDPVRGDADPDIIHRREFDFTIAARRASLHVDDNAAADSLTRQIDLGRNRSTRLYGLIEDHRIPRAAEPVDPHHEGTIAGRVTQRHFEPILHYEIQHPTLNLRPGEVPAQVYRLRGQRPARYWKTEGGYLHKTREHTRIAPHLPDGECDYCRIHGLDLKCSDSGSESTLIWVEVESPGKIHFPHSLGYLDNQTVIDHLNSIFVVGEILKGVVLGKHRQVDFDIPGRHFERIQRAAEKGGVPESEA